MSKDIEFCVVYRFKVRSGYEDTFRKAWTRITEEIRDKRAGLGSRLHLAEDGWWVAYAQWPNRTTWERSLQMEATDVDATKMMSESIVERMPPILMEPKIDLLVS